MSYSFEYMREGLLSCLLREKRRLGVVSRGFGDYYVNNLELSEMSRYDALYKVMEDFVNKWRYLPTSLDDASGSGDVLYGIASNMFHIVIYFYDELMRFGDISSCMFSLSDSLLETSASLAIWDSSASLASLACVCPPQSPKMEMIVSFNMGTIILRGLSDMMEEMLVSNGRRPMGSLPLYTISSDVETAGLLRTSIELLTNDCRETIGINSPYAMIMDWHMRRIYGMRVYEQIRERRLAMTQNRTQNRTQTIDQGEEETLDKKGDMPYICNTFSRAFGVGMLPSKVSDLYELEPPDWVIGFMPVRL